jgi:hypothetical protein
VPGGAIAADSGLSLLGGVVDHLGALAKEEDEQERSIGRIRYQNMALEASVRAYRDHPTDLDAYKSAYRESLSGCDIPLSERASYEGILLNSEARFYSPIVLNRAEEDGAREREELLALVDNLFEDGTLVLGGSVGASVPWDGNYVGDRYLESVGVLGSVGADGRPVLPPDDILAKVEEYELGALTTAAGRQIAGAEDPLAAVERYIGGDGEGEGEEYVAEVASSGGVIRLSSGALSAGGREQLRANMRGAVVKNLEDRSARKRFALGAELMRLPALWSGSAEQRRALDTWAGVQISAQPITAATERQHLDNMITFARRYSYIPEGYVDVLRSAINSGSAHVCVSGARMLDVAIESGGGRISKQFDDGTLLRASMLHDLVWNGAMDPNKAVDAVNSIFNNPRSRDYTVQLNEKLRGLKNKRDRTMLYGDDVSAEEYGPDEVSMYESLVRDYYLTNGGDGKSARSVARARIDAIYSYPNYGAYRRKGWWIFKRGGRKLKYQPGAYYGDDVEERIDRDIVTNVIPQIRDGMGYSDITGENYFLVANMLTVDAFTGGKREPAWELWYVNGNGSSVQVTDRRGNIATYRVGDLGTGEGNKGKENKALRRQAKRWNIAVEQLRGELARPDNERLFLRMFESGGEGI